MFIEGKNVITSLGNNLEIKWVWCNPGNFKMRYDFFNRVEKMKEYEIKFTEGFWVSETLMTEQVWFFFFNEYHDKYMAQSEVNFDYPLFILDYEDVSNLVYKFKDLLQPQIENMFIGLPNFMEWEYFARAGSKEGYFFGKDERKFAKHAWYRANIDDAGSRKVKTKKPNPWGIYDLFGNVSEYCYDVDFGNNSDNLLINPKSQIEVDVSLPIKGGNYDSKFEDFFADKITYSNATNDFNDPIGMRLLVKNL